MGRKTVRDGGKTALLLCAEIAQLEATLESRSEPECAQMLLALKDGRLALEATIDYVVQHAGKQTKAVYAGAVNYLKLAGLVLVGWQMARALLVALDERAQDPSFHAAKIATARFYAEALLPQARALAVSVMASGGTVEGMAEELF